MAAADRKITYTAAEVAELIRPLTQSVEALQKENAELKQKLEHMNECRFVKHIGQRTH